MVWSWYKFIQKLITRAFQIQMIWMIVDHVSRQNRETILIQMWMIWNRVYRIIQNG